MNAPSQLVLLRHGQSLWNLEKRFTGWIDVDLSEVGREEARKAGAILRDAGFSFDVFHTSFLKRAINTTHLAQEALDQLWTNVHRHWRLNERHYGALQGLRRDEAVRIHGEEAVRDWRRSYGARPPRLPMDDLSQPRHDHRYRHLLYPYQLPDAESLEDTLKRIRPCWSEAIVPDIAMGRRVCIVAHGNSLRALVKHLEGLSDADIARVEIPMGVPIIYELDGEMRPTRHYRLNE